jgi:alpha-glucosidase
MPGSAWWQRGAIYQIYLRSFADSDGDGVGDLRGIAEHLDHLSDLGVAAVWLSPIFPSPMADFGYDVADYCDVDPVFGTLADLDRLVEMSHARGIRVVLDWVANHTSDRHPWFVESRSSRVNERRDWYVWRNGRPDGGPPNDWRSHFRAVGSAWSFDRHTGQWYLHSFTPRQPDLDWDNPEVRSAMHDVLRFWLDRGIDGFRLDAISSIAKDPLLRDNAGSTRRHDEDWGTIHERLREIRRVVDEYEDRMIVGEVLPLDLHRIFSYVDGGDALHLAHNFVFVEQPWDAAGFARSIDAFEALAREIAWPAWFLANHDYPRVATRFGDDGQGPARARAVALLLYALRGTPFIYQGEELGLPDAEIPPGLAVDLNGRDGVRAPMPWRPPSVAGPGAGFTTGTPWLPLVAGAENLCVERQTGDSRSMLTLVRRLAALRASTPALRSGRQRLLECGENVLSWLREEDGDRLLAAMNFAAAPMPLGLHDGEATGRAALLVSSDPNRDGTDVDVDTLLLGAGEALLLRL